MLLLLFVREAAKSRVLRRDGPGEVEARAPATVGADEGPRFVREPDRLTVAKRR